MLASLFLDECQKNGIGFFSGVPDSLLKGFCDELFVRYGTDGNTHVVAHNEGGAIALCAGHYLATGKPGLCYMQNRDRERSQSACFPDGSRSIFDPLYACHWLARGTGRKGRTSAR